MIKNKANKMFIFFAFCSLIISTMFIDTTSATPAYNGTTGSKNYATSGDCSTAFGVNLFCQYNNTNHTTIKLSLYYFNGTSRTKIGSSIYYTNRLDLLTGNYINISGTDTLRRADIIDGNGNVTAERNLYHFMLLKLVDVSSLISLAGTLEDLLIGQGQSYPVLETVLEQMGTSLGALNKPSQAMNPTTPATYGYRIIIEPVVTMVNSDGSQFALTIKQMANTSYGRKIVNSKHWADGRGFAAWAVTEHTDVGITAYTADTCKAKSGTDSDFATYIANLNSGCGYNIIDISVAAAPKCDIGVNNNTDTTKNWVESYSCKVSNFDGVEEDSTCWRKIENGCCETANYEAAGYTKEQVRAIYPQCFEAECVDEKKIYINDTEKTSIDDVSCGFNSTKITNLKGYINKDSQVSLECLTTNNYLVGVKSGWRLGCTFSDTLNLPKKYIEIVSIGQHFVWPTSETTYKLGNRNLNYPLTRESNVKCLIYKYNNDGSIHYPSTITDNFKRSVKEFFEKKISGNLYLKYKDERSGTITEESGKTQTNVSAENNKVINVSINKTYTLPILDKKNKNYGIYAYYDQEALVYTNKPDKDLSNYTKYGYPILPMGNYKDKSVSINYGIEFENIKFSLLEQYSGDYKCDKQASEIDDFPCVCPSGTFNEGMDLTDFFPDGYTNFKAECSIAIDKYCDNIPIEYICTNIQGQKINITNCINEKQNSGNKFEYAYNSCYLEKCPPDTNNPYMCPNDKTISLTNCVKNGTYGGATDEEKYKKCVENKCPRDDKGDIIYRTIFLNTPFPGINDNGRVAGANWGGSKALANDGLGTKYIISTADKMYQGDPMYSIILTPSAVKEIRKYNKEHGYDDFELSCGDDQYCVSNALHDILGQYFNANGTCHLKIDAKKRGNDDCRLTSLVK